MIQTVTRILQEQHILSHLNEGIAIASVATAHDGVLLAGKILTTIVDTKTVLYLSGGSTPQALYKKLAHEKHMTAGAIGLIDERYGEPMHEKSNELMIRETGLLSYAKSKGIPLYLPLQGVSREETAIRYDETLRQLTAIFQKSVGVLGIGNDGHTSGIAPNRTDFDNPLFAKDRSHLFFSEFSDPHSFYGERVAMTFLGLSLLDVLVVLVFGASKKHPLDQLFVEGSEEEIPARFYKRPEIAKKTLFITDQRI